MREKLKVKNLLWSLLILTLIIFAGCEKEYLDVFDPIQNFPPIIKRIEAPDTLYTSSGDTLKIFVRAEVYDSDGLNDLKAVYFNSFLPDGSPSRSNPIYMYDDGNFQTNGDLVVGDGIYSRIIILPPNTQKGKYRFEFQAIDKKDELSNIISHNIVVK